MEKFISEQIGFHNDVCGGYYYRCGNVFFNPDNKMKEEFLIVLILLLNEHLKKDLLKSGIDSKYIEFIDDIYNYFSNESFKLNKSDITSDFKTMINKQDQQSKDNYIKIKPKIIEFGKMFFEIFKEQWDIDSIYDNNVDVDDDTNRCICNHIIHDICCIRYTDTDGKSHRFQVGNKCIEKISPELCEKECKRIEQNKFKKNDALPCDNCGMFLNPKNMNKPTIINQNEYNLCSICKQQKKNWLQFDSHKIINNKIKDDIEKLSEQTFNRFKKIKCKEPEFLGRGITNEEAFVEFRQYFENRVSDNKSMNKFIFEAKKAQINNQDELVYNNKKCKTCCVGLSKETFFCGIECENIYNEKFKCSFCHNIIDPKYKDKIKLKSPSDECNNYTNLNKNLRFNNDIFCSSNCMMKKRELIVIKKHNERIIIKKFSCNNCGKHLNDSNPFEIRECNICRNNDDFELINYYQIRISFNDYHSLKINPDSELYRLFRDLNLKWIGEGKYWKLLNTKTNENKILYFVNKIKKDSRIELKIVYHNNIKNNIDNMTLSDLENFMEKNDEFDEDTVLYIKKRTCKLDSDINFLEKYDFQT